MKITGISELLGESIPTDVSAAEFLLEKYPEKCFFVDFFPRSIEAKYAFKQDQIEKQIYHLIYERMNTVLLKAWVYDDWFVESDLLFDDGSDLHGKRFDRLKRRNMKRSMQSNCIESVKNLKKLLALSRDDIIDLTLVARRMKIVIAASWSCFVIFINDDADIPFMEEIIRTEGLSLRQPTQCHA